MTQEATRPDDDQQQVTTLCDTLEQRADTMRTEEHLLADLAGETARTRPFRSRRYAELLNEVRQRAQQLRATILRYCRPR